MQTVADTNKKPQTSPQKSSTTLAHHHCGNNPRLLSPETSLPPGFQEALQSQDYLAVRKQQNSTHANRERQRAACLAPHLSSQCFKNAEAIYTHKGITRATGG